MNGKIEGLLCFAAVFLLISGRVSALELRGDGDEDLGRQWQLAAGSRASSWTDGKGRFTLIVDGGNFGRAFKGTILIENLTDDVLSFPTPWVMPLAGNTNKNNIRVYDASGKKIKIWGRHWDSRSRHATSIAAHESKSWQFDLERFFPALKKAGEHRVELWYFSGERDQATWKGRVKAAPIYILSGGKSEASWSDDKARFGLKVTGGRNNESFAADLTIENVTDGALLFPTPQIMPMCGDTGKNNIRVYDTSGNELEIDGIHLDGKAGDYPTTRIGAKSTKAWKILLDEGIQIFPGLNKPGKYEVEFFYFSNWDEAGKWKGRVAMERIAIERVDGVSSVWTDGKAAFRLSVEGGRDGAPFMVAISIANLTDTPLSFPTPLVMPLAGDGNTNNIRVYEASGKKLAMEGVHADYGRDRPATMIGPKSNKTWRFRLDNEEGGLDDRFPALKKAGKYEVELWYYTDENNANSWRGRVRMGRVFIERRTAK